MERCLGFPGGSAVENLPANEGDPSSIPGSGSSSGEGHSNPLQCSCLENPMGRGAWWATVHGLAKCWTRLSELTSQRRAVPSIKYLCIQCWHHYQTDMTLVSQFCKCLKPLRQTKNILEYLWRKCCRLKKPQSWRYPLEH